MKIEILGPIPIPVGHRVSVRWFHRKNKGLFGGVTEESHPTQPLIEDLDTGIVHSFDWLYDFAEAVVEEGGNPARAWPSRISESFGNGIEEQRSVVGRVTACRLCTSILGADTSGTVLTQTHLTLAPENGPSAYR